MRGNHFVFTCRSTVSTRRFSFTSKRAVAQLGSALEWGSRGPEFESRQPDIGKGKKRPCDFVCGLSESGEYSVAENRPLLHVHR